MIHVVIPHYRATRWLTPCLSLLRRRSTSHAVRYTVLAMEDDRGDVEAVRRAVDGLANVVEYPTPGMIGGEPLTCALTHGTKLIEDSIITVTVDPDALVMAGGWDQRLIQLFADPDMAVAGINPRSETREFGGFAEWNWMAFRTRFWLQHVAHFSPHIDRLHDFGHILTHAAEKHGKRQHLWPRVATPIPGKAATVCGDEVDPAFVCHAFYSTRKRRDRIPEEEMRWILTDEQEAKLIEYCTVY